jgi:hypothetical protein
MNSNGERLHSVLTYVNILGSHMLYVPHTKWLLPDFFEIRVSYSYTYIHNKKYLFYYIGYHFLWNYLILPFGECSTISFVIQWNKVILAKVIAQLLSIY